MNKIDVKLMHSKNDVYKVGTLLAEEKNIYFEYDSDFLATPFEISPIMLPKKTGVQTLNSISHLQKLWGVFHDSLPDSWGLLLMDRYFKTKRKSLQNISLLDRLSFVGERGSGSLVYYPVFEMGKNNSKDQVDLNYLNEEGKKILSGKTEMVIPELLRMGGSPGGARPKIYVGLNSKNEIISGVDELPKNYEHWIVKFNSRFDVHDAGAVEFIYAQMATLAGVTMSEVRLIITDDKNRFFATKRFDRDHDLRFHLHTFANVIGADFSIPSTDYLDIMKVSYTLTKSHQDLERILRVMIFNIMACNRDDHAKNFSFIMNHAGQWSFAPAYDLTFSLGPGGEHSNTVFGEGKKPSREHVYKIADEFGIKRSLVNDIIDQTAYALTQWKYLCLDLEISKKEINRIEKQFTLFI